MLGRLIGGTLDRLNKWRAARRTSLVKREPRAPCLRAPSPALQLSSASTGPVFDPERIVAYFQPQLCCHTGAVIGFEALARLDDPQLGIVTPEGFMPRLSQQERVQLTQSMLRQCIAALKLWDRAGFEVGRIGLNISPSELAAPRLAEQILWELDRSDISPRRFAIEVLETENPLLGAQDIRANLRRLTDAGCGIDLDDFGTGFATLESIRSLGVDRLKVDRSFVTHCHDRPEQTNMILAILALAEHLGLTTVAEGVESQEEQAFLSQIGCDSVQGYFISRPMPLAKTEIWLLQHQAQQASLPEIRRA